MNDVLVRKQARAVRIDEYLILQGEPDWSDALLFGVFKVREIEHHSEDTVTFRTRPAPGSYRRVLRNPEYQIGFVEPGWFEIRQAGRHPAVLVRVTVWSRPDHHSLFRRAAAAALGDHRSALKPSDPAKKEDDPMPTPTTRTCHGYTLHFFDAGAGSRGSDKYYTGLWYRTQAGTSSIFATLIHYGRDGTVGQCSTAIHVTQGEAEALLEKKLTEKLRHGYELLGRGVVELPVPLGSNQSIGAEFRERIKHREADKSRMSGGLLIQEEPDIRDLLDDLMHR